MADSEPYRVAMVGCGRISTLNAMAYSNLDKEDDWQKARIYACVDPNKENRVRRAQEWRAEVMYESLDEALRDPKVEIVELMTPHLLHVKHTLQCLEAGKHTSLQKPPTVNLAEMDRIAKAVKTAEGKGIKFHVFENFRHHPPYLRANEILASGAVGDLQAVNYTMVTSTWEPEQWKVPLSTWKWRLREDENWTSPTIFDDGYHKHSLMHQWLGPIESVQGWKGGYKIRGLITVDQPADMIYKAKNGTYGTWKTTMTPYAPTKSDWYGGDEWMHMACSRGLIFVNGCTANTFVGASGCGGVGEPGVHWLDKSGQWHSECDMKTNWKYSFAYCGRYFVDETIEGSGKASLEVGEAKNILRTSLAIITSMRSNSKNIPVNSITHGVETRTGA